MKVKRGWPGWGVDNVSGAIMLRVCSGRLLR